MFQNIFINEQFTIEGRKKDIKSEEKEPEKIIWKEKEVSEKVIRKEDKEKYKEIKPRR